MSLQNSQRENVFTLNLKLMESTEGSKIFVKINKAFTLQLGTGYLNHFLHGWLSVQGSPSYSSPQPLQEKSLGPLSSEANLFSLLVTAFQVPLQSFPLLIHKYWDQVFSRSILIAILPSLMYSRLSDRMF